MIQCLPDSDGLLMGDLKMKMVFPETPQVSGGEGQGEGILGDVQALNCGHPCGGRFILTNNGILGMLTIN